MLVFATPSWHPLASSALPFGGQRSHRNHRTKLGRDEGKEKTIFVKINLTSGIFDHEVVFMYIAY